MNDKMITMTWGNLRDNEFVMSLEKLFGKGLGFENGVRLALLGQEIKAQRKLLTETHETILKKFGTPDKERPGMYNIPENQREGYAEEMKKFEEHPFETKIKRFDALKLSESIDFTPQDLMLLEPLLLPFEIPADDKAPLKAVAAPAAGAPAPSSPASH